MIVTHDEWQRFLQKAVTCPRCRWSSTISMCDPVADEVVRCPICGKAVQEAEDKKIRFREFL